LVIHAGPVGDQDVFGVAAPWREHHPLPSSPRPKGHDQSAVELAAYDATPDDRGGYQP